MASHLGKEIRHLGIVCISGGQHSATGNVIGKHSEEGNFSYDPESAFLVLKVIFYQFNSDIQKDVKTNKLVCDSNRNDFDV